MDMEKISRLYADLRRESLSTGSFPITVRHLESTIRMAEASAKMHLRTSVRSDDIDLAIQVTIGSFVSAQKLSIKKQLERVRSARIRLEQPADVSYRASRNTLQRHKITKNCLRSFLAKS